MRPCPAGRQPKTERSASHDCLAKKGWGQVSLSVQKLNGAVRLYRRLGFKVADENSEEYIMVKELGRQ